LPGQALRMARWTRLDGRLAGHATMTRSDAKPGGENPGAERAQPRRRYFRLSPMRPGRPPGWRRRPNHDVTALQCGRETGRIPPEYLH
jgi:hypothetical protein